MGPNTPLYPIGLVHDIFTRNIYGVNINILVNDCSDGTNLY